MTESIWQRTWSRSTRWIVLAMLLVSLVGCDQRVKMYAVEHWQDRAEMSYLGGLLKIQYAENRGAFLSLLANFPDEVRFWVLTVANGMLLVGLLLYLTIPRHQHAYTFLSLALVLAGGIGNLIDRIRLQAVIDFFNIGVGGLRSGIFNVADMAITAGFLMLLPWLVYGDSGTSASTSPPQAVSTAGESQE